MLNEKQKLVAKESIDLHSNISVLKKETKDGCFAYSIIETIENHPLCSQRITSLYGKTGDYEISPRDVISLYKGFSLARTLKTKTGEEANTFIAAKGITKKTIEKNGITYENDVLDLGYAYPKYNKKAGEVLGYKADGIMFFKNVRLAGKEDRFVELKPEDCIRLATGMKILKDGATIQLDQTIDQVLPNGSCVKSARMTAFKRHIEDSDEQKSVVASQKF